MVYKTKKYLLFSIFFGLFLTALGYWIQSITISPQREPATRSLSELSYYNDIKPIFESRCIGCHSCGESPCQFNLQSYEGFLRGGHKQKVYNASRQKAQSPSRMFIDAQTTEQWREKGFYSVKEEKEDSIFLNYLAKPNSNRNKPTAEPQHSNTCYNQNEQSRLVQSNQSHLSMPYGLPALADTDYNKIVTWIKQGASEGKPLSTTSPEEDNTLRSWESFLNNPDLKHRITARYLYEHLFLASIHLTDSPSGFYRLVRSKTPCDSGVQTIATPTPNTDPKVSSVYYCFLANKNSPANRTHIPFRMDLQKLDRYKKLFIESKWVPTYFPSYAKEVAQNPFKSFKQMPVEARYRFLIEDAEYHIMTFIKGPVCNGTTAINVIQEQFYVFFTSPSRDLMINDYQYRRAVESLSLIPGEFGNEVQAIETLPFYQRMITKRTALKKKRNEAYLRTHQNGTGLDEVWDGDQFNQNAVLTVFRHGENAKVLKGPVGDSSKTAFLLDYSLFEKLSYDLVVNFDVYGTMGHQLLTRIYMDLIRMEAENNFLSMLPEQARLMLKLNWYQGLLSSSKLLLLNEYDFPKHKINIQYDESSSHGSVQNQLYQQIIFNRLNQTVRGPDDTINWVKLKSTSPLDTSEASLRKIAQLKGENIKYLPELAYIVVSKNGQKNEVYSLIHNRVKKNISFIFGENTNLDPKQDSLVITKKWGGPSPQMFFAVTEKNLGSFAEQLSQVNSVYKYLAFEKRWGIQKNESQFWTFYDFTNSFFAQQNPTEASAIDLSKYGYNHSL
jgi:hypothetical protein